MEAFNAPYSVQLLEIDSVGMYDTAIEDMGKALVSTELGGAVHRARTNATLPKVGFAQRLDSLLAFCKARCSWIRRPGRHAG
jgi:predicted deacylase